MGIASQSNTRGNVLELFDVAATEHDRVDLQCEAERFGRLRDVATPFLFSKPLEPATPTYAS